MVTIREISKNEAKIVHHIAHETWPCTFGEILSKAQIEYMLEWMYNIPHLEEQMENGHHFAIIERTGHPVGFLGYELNNPETGVMKIHKIYVLPSGQGGGLGKELMDYAKRQAQHFGMKKITLNVNRYNKATTFYQHLGYAITKEEDIDIGNGYLMEDYVLDYNL